MNTLNNILDSGLLLYISIITGLYIIIEIIKSKSKKEIVSFLSRIIEVIINISILSTLIYFTDMAIHYLGINHPNSCRLTLINCISAGYLITIISISVEAIKKRSYEKLHEIKPGNEK